MNKITIFSLLLLVCFISHANSEVVDRRIILKPGGQQPNHSELPIPADQPNVYYDTVNQQIIIDGTGFVSYYDVEICSVVTWDMVISTQVSGSYDTIDISSLPTGEYCISIDSPAGNTYEGFFDTY